MSKPNGGTDEEIERAENHLLDAQNALEAYQQELRKTDANGLYPDEIHASVAVLYDLEQVIESHQNRMDQGIGYDQPDRISELISNASEISE